MAKGKAKNDSNSLAPPQPRSLRSRKKECPTDEISETDDDQAPLLHQCHQIPLQESTMASAQQHQTAEQSCLTKQDPSTKERHVETTNVSLKNMMDEVKAKKDTSVTNPNNDSQLGFAVLTDNDANQNGKKKEGLTAEEFNRSPSQTCTVKLKYVLPTFEEGNGSCAATPEVQVGAKEDSHCNLKRNKETSHKERSNVYVANVKEVTKDAEAGLLAKKKRRMGMCGLTEKERSHFLQTQKCENGLNRPDKVEKQIWNKTADPVVQEEIISLLPLPSSLSLPADRVTEQVDIKLKSSYCGGDNRAETEVHVAFTALDGTSAVCDPGCLKVKSFEAEAGIVSGLEQTGDTKSDPSAEKELLGNLEQLEMVEHAAGDMNEKLQEQMNDKGDRSAVVDQSPAISFHSNPMQNEETEDRNANEAAPLQVNNLTRTRGEKREELTCDTEDGDRAEASASSTTTWSGGFQCGLVELCEGAVSPSGSERKDSCDQCDDKPRAGPSTLNNLDPQTRDATDLFGSGCFDYVSDSQLNTIALIEERVMETEDDLDSPDCHDATDLICGLIRELSSLNQKVMATHRELENLRRSSKSSRSSIR